MPARMQSPADCVILGGRAITMHPDAAPDYNGVAIQGDRILRLIRREEVDEVRGPGTRVIDVGERPIMPGFVDPHAHAEVVCRTSFGTIDCRAPECSTIEDVCDALSTGLGAGDSEGWVIGQANLFFDRKLREGRLPSRAELDRVSRDVPIALRAGGHITVLNSKGLEVAGIDRNYQPPSFSVTGLPIVVRDADGEPTGVVKEMDSLLPFPTYSKERLRVALSEGLNNYFTRFGVTTIGEVSETVDGIECLGEMAEDEKLPTSFRTYLWAPGTLKLKDACDWRKTINLSASEVDVRIQGIKIFSDGGFSARSAAVACPYIGEDGYCGDIAFSKYFFRRAFEETQKRGMQLAVHANGDRAQEWLCQCVTEMGGAGSGRSRLRVEHAGNFLPRRRTRDWWAKAGIIPVPQPVFIYTFGEYFPDYLGDYGRIGRFPFRTLLAEGWRLSGSSDVWIGSEREATNPLFSVWCCLKRQTYSGAYIDEHEGITLQQALRMHTIDAAAVMGEDDLRGSLAPGKIADVIALDRDPFSVSVDELRSLRVDYVMARGRTVRNQIGQAGSGTGASEPALVST
jgi:predicted amidohydrolase YtcJ